MKVHQTVSLFILIIGSVSGLFAQELAEEEIRGVAGGDVEFFNYEGPHAKIETIEEIRSIGASLSSRRAASEDGEAEYFRKYRILSIPPAEDSSLYGADIFYIEEGAAVDHIDNVRRILSGYLQSRFDYSREDAETISVFITFYNAVHRTDMEYIRGNYHEGVVENLDPEKAGIATRYSEWPGNTQMLIPLRTVGAQEALSTDTVGGDEVVEEMRQQEDRGVEERKEMVEIRDRELEEEKQATEEERRRLEEEEQKTAEREQEREAAEEELEKTRAEEGEDSPEAQEAERRVEEAEEALQEQKEREETQREVTQEQEEEIEEREREVQEEREKIAEDQKELIEEEATATAASDAESDAADETDGTSTAAVSTVPFILFEDGAELLGRLVEVEKGSGRILRRAQVNTIRSKSMARAEKGFVLVAGNDSPPQAIRLVEIESESLEIVGQSDVDIYAGSTLEQKDGRIYAITGDSDGWYVGRFNEDLSLAAKSEDEVAPHSMLMFENGSLYTQAENGDVMLLDPGTLQRQ